MKNNKRFAVTALFSVLICGFILSCDTPAGSNPIQEDGTTFQSQLANAQAGSTITLNSANTGTSIVISKALTVDGNGIKNLEVIVNPEVAANVTLKNFVDATISIIGSGVRSASKARKAGDDPKADSKPREIGDENPKLYFEKCSFEKISAEKDISIYMEEDALKSTVKEIELKNGVENFVLIEDEDEALAKEKKSLIEKIIIEKGIKEVDLLGAYYKDIEFKGEFSAEDKFDFYYDEKGNQVEADFRAYLLEQEAKVAARDICTVKNGEGVYKFTIPTGEIDNLKNGAVSIILLKDNQKTAFLNSDMSNGPNWKWASIDEPYFDITSSGYFKFETSDNSLHSICGDATSNYFGASDSTDYYEFFNNYSKEGICSQKTASGLDIYIDLSKLAKTDLATSAFKENGMDDVYYCQPNKLTLIDLKDYKPYIVIDSNKYCESGNMIDTLKTSFTFENSDVITFPASKSNGSGGIHNGFFTAMTAAQSYPDVSNVSLNMWKTGVMLELYEVYDNGGSALTHRLTLEKFKAEVQWGQAMTEYDYFLDEECTQLFWPDLNSDSLERLYIKPIGKVTIYNMSTESYDTSRMDIWYYAKGMTFLEPIGVYIQNKPTLADLTAHPEIEITDINDLIPGQTYYICKKPAE
ncbi:MAG: hypothetical protein MJ188_11990 [Treponema sp.]|nr:hypothetical protein [Treponema sp.]